MGGVSRYFSKVSGSGVDVVLLSLGNVSICTHPQDGVSVKGRWGCSRQPKQDVSNGETSVSVSSIEKCQTSYRDSGPRDPHTPSRA